MKIHSNESAMPEELNLDPERKTPLLTKYSLKESISLYNNPEP